jgi:anaerobic selenocysteine-containing dehydrogenase
MGFARPCSGVWPPRTRYKSPGPRSASVGGADPILLIHPETARSLRVEDGAWVTVDVPNGPGACRLRAKISDRTPPGVVSTGMGWWRPASAAPDHGALDININAALPYDGRWDPASGSVDSRGLLCRVRAAPSAAARA